MLKLRGNINYLIVFLIIHHDVQGSISGLEEQRVKVAKTREIGYFWHLSDIFFDPFYAILDTPKSECRAESGESSSRNCGFFGQFETCSALRLIETIGRTMVKRSGNISDFCIFTGNIRCPNQQHALDAIYEAMGTFLASVKDAGINCDIYLSHGWYDYHPYGHHSINSTTFYRKMSEVLQNTWETVSRFESSWLMGYFSRVQLPRRRIRVIVLNTNYYLRNHIASQMADPSGQWSWLNGQLKGCRTAGQKAYIVMSVPPGVHEANYGSSGDLLWSDRHNKRYVRIIRRYRGVIAAQFAGHHRLDTFRLVYSKTEEVVSAILLAPPVEPRNSNFPAMRLYMYDLNTGELLDYVQYYFNLTEANLHSDATEPENYWKTGYTFRDHYALPDISLQSLEVLVGRMRKNDIIFRRYIRTTRSMQDGGLPCTHRCKMVVMCAIANLDLISFFECLSGLDATTDRGLDILNNTRRPIQRRDYLLRNIGLPRGIVSWTAKLTIIGASFTVLHVAVICV